MSIIVSPFLKRTVSYAEGDITSTASRRDTTGRSEEKPNLPSVHKSSGTELMHSLAKPRISLVQYRGKLEQRITT
jgi:hypothetical protein